MEIDIERPMPGSIHFAWKEFLWLDKWSIHVHPTALQAENLKKMGSLMERVRSIFNRPITITSGLRPEIYNKKIKGAPGSAHIIGLACDFIVKDLEGVVGCEAVREQIKPFLDGWGFRMENKPDSNWVHVDLRPPGKSGRFFTP